MNDTVSEKESLFEKLQNLSQYHSTRHRAELFCSFLNVVVEGYQELKYENENIDNLLCQRDRVLALKLLNSAIFDYYKQPIPEHAMKFFESKENELWLNELHNSFGAFFESELSAGEVLI